jgi:hypothetical protein
MPRAIWIWNKRTLTNWIFVSRYHCRCFKKGTIEENTAGVINVIKKKDIDIISHPADGTVDLLFER